MNRHILSVLVNDRPGVLSRVSGMFNRRGFNISSLAVGPSETPGLSRMTIELEGNEAVLDQITKQLNKLIDVVKIEDFTRSGRNFVHRELVLIKVKTGPSSRAEIFEITKIFRSKIIDVAPDALVIEATGDEGKLKAILKLLEKFGIVELVRTGKIALGRGLV